VKVPAAQHIGASGRVPLSAGRCGRGAAETQTNALFASAKHRTATSLAEGREGVGCYHATAARALRSSFLAGTHDEPEPNGAVLRVAARTAVEPVRGAARTPEGSDMKITGVEAHPVSFRVPQGQNVRLGIGRSVKRDAVLVKVTTDEGVTGWGEAHHGRAPGAIARLVDSTVRELVQGMDARDTVGVWDRVYRMQLASHGMGAAAAMALSGVDLALWDIRGKAAGLPLHRLAGGAPRPVAAYAGGISLGWQEPSSLADEALAHVAAGYRALKIRVGDTPARDVARVAAVRAAVGDDIVLLVDANTGYALDDARRAMPAFEEHAVRWLEEPFPAHDYRAYREAAGFARVGLAAGENHYTRFEFTRLVEDGAVSFVQPDLSKTGGMTEALRIAALASAWKLGFNPHTSATALNMAASVHALCAVDNAGYFEGDVTTYNPFRDEMGATPYALDANGCVHPLEAPGIGIEVDADFVRAHPLIDGPCYV
jgi:L-alanine-DL-glutamate epimerase-like enolase superfamily enzyme